MKSEEHYFNEAESIESYMNKMSQLQDKSFTVYESFALPDDELAETLREQSLHFLVITEDWCGDAMMINPIIRQIAEAANMEMRVVLRDSEPELIDRHLTNSSRSIPIILILDYDGTVIGKWGPRSPKAQALIDEYAAALPDQDDPEFQAAQKDMIKALTYRFTTDETLWHDVYESFKQTVQQAINDKQKH
ncbi:thiol-disulfide isomerase/thioredoxin [Alkalibacillus flavidus]|uniref:Thiol-disulfide isomerase/thioredoxin n=1 Tax=Alkalibacillus flavidus TaxID=546021 RepID=A0ABV2KYA8_9BACI